MAGSGSGSSEEGDAGPSWRTVTPRYRSRPNTEMTTIGYIYLIILIVVLLPLLPFLAVIWVIGRLMEDRRESSSGREEGPR